MSGRHGADSSLVVLFAFLFLLLLFFVGLFAQAWISINHSGGRHICCCKTKFGRRVGGEKPHFVRKKTLRCRSLRMNAQPYYMKMAGAPLPPSPDFKAMEEMHGMSAMNNMSSLVAPAAASPQIVLVRQSSPTQEKISKNGIQKNVHVVVKNTPFMVQIGLTSPIMLATSPGLSLDFRNLLLEVLSSSFLNWHTKCMHVELSACTTACTLHQSLNHIWGLCLWIWGSGGFGVWQW